MLFLTLIIITPCLVVAAVSNLSSAAAAALAYDRASYINGFVLDDPFYADLPPYAEEAAAGTLLQT